MTTKEIKQRHWDKKYREAPVVECACGCGEQLKAMDHYGRPRRFINGHNNRKYEDPTQFKREWNHRNREKRQKYKTEYAHKRKAKLLRMLGGKCTVCNRVYDGKNGAGFDMHHRNPEDKCFALNQAQLINRAWDTIMVEAQKCNITCAYCHRLLHSEEF
jgi:hypothetical protein